MTKYQAKNCKNFQPVDVTVIGDKEKALYCAQPYCRDFDNCDHIVYEPLPDLEVGFEPKRELLKEAKK